MKLLASLLLAALVAGCSKKDSASPQTQSSAEPQTQNSPTEAQPDQSAVGTPAARPEAPQAAAPQPAAQPQAVQVVVVEGAIHAPMTIALQKFIRENGRMPKDFSEFASGSIDSVPFAPPGMEYVIDYANKQVKVAKIKKK
jgi:hypothetical protein